MVALQKHKSFECAMLAAAPGTQGLGKHWFGRKCCLFTFSLCFKKVLKTISKSVEKLVFQLLAGSWSWWLLFPVKILIETVLKN